MSTTNADIKASREIAVNPLVSRKRASSSASSGLEKDATAFQGHQTIDHSHPTGTGHGIDPSKHNATFETFGNESYYTPIEAYEGKHRYDPTFEWEPTEERKLVRKVWIHSKTVSNTINHPTLTDEAGSPYLLLGLPHVLRPPTGPWQHCASPDR